MYVSLVNNKHVCRFLVNDYSILNKMLSVAEQIPLLKVKRGRNAIKAKGRVRQIGLHMICEI